MRDREHVNLYLARQRSNLFDSNWLKAYLGQNAPQCLPPAAVQHTDSYRFSDKKETLMYVVCMNHRFNISRAMEGSECKRCACDMPYYSHIISRRSPGAPARRSTRLRTCNNPLGFFRMRSIYLFIYFSCYLGALLLNGFLRIAFNHSPCDRRIDNTIHSWITVFTAQDSQCKYTLHTHSTNESGDAGRYSFQMSFAMIHYSSVSHSGTPTIHTYARSCMLICWMSFLIYLFYKIPNSVHKLHTAHRTHGTAISEQTFLKCTLNRQTSRSPVGPSGPR